MRLFQRIAANTVFVLNILTIFLLIFRARLEFPAWVQSVGRMHPLLLHLPVGLLVLLTLLLLARKHFDKAALYDFVSFILYLLALTSAFTAFMGLVLSGEGGYDKDLVTWHMISGIALSILSWIILLLHVHVPEQKKAFLSLVTITLICLLVTGHLGASITHGDKFVFQPLINNDGAPVVITDSTSLYAAAVFPVLNSKCVSCHNEKKAKGELIMTSLDKFMEGGKNGHPWTASDPGSSLMIKRLLLPEDHDDHMPPSGKPQLTREEFTLLHDWIQSGADTKTAWTQFSPGDSLRLLAELFIRKLQLHSDEARHYKFPFAPTETITRLNTPFLTVAQFAIQEPALKADFFLRQAFDKNKLTELLDVKDQLVSVNLSKMPVTDSDCNTLSKFSNLERLNLNNTAISGKDLTFLTNLKKLQTVSLAGTAADLASVRSLGALPELKEVFLWNTQVDEKGIEELKKAFPKINWSKGFIPDQTDILRLTPPILVNENTVLEQEEAIHLKHNLPGTSIRFTLDGIDPDSTTSALYKDPLTINGFVKLKARACKDGWYSSSVLQQYIFKKGIEPSEAKLLTAADKEYKGEGITSLINNKKGTADNHRDIAWLGFRDNACVATFRFKNGDTVNSINISYAHNTGAYLMPPASVEVWGGNSSERLSLIKSIMPVQPKEFERTRIEVIPVKLNEITFEYYKVVINPVPRLPLWHSGKGQKGWIFVDEIFFN